MPDTTDPAASEWLGLSRLQQLFEHRHAEALADAATPRGEEVIDRLQRTLEIVGVVEQGAQLLRDRARGASHHETMQLAAELRRLAHRVEAVGEFLLGVGHQVLELEDGLLQELDERIRAASRASLPATPAAQAGPGAGLSLRWAEAHAA